MRSFLLIAGTFALLVGLFFGYTMMQTGHTVVDRPTDVASSTDLTFPAEPRESIVGEGEDAWVEMRDANWQVISRFRARKYDPRKDGRVEVTGPEAVFFMSDGQRLRIRGREGVVAMSRLPEPGQDPRNLGPRQAPTRGELREVEIELYDSQEAMDADEPDRPMELIRVTLDNATFDNETFRIFTTDTTIDGQPVAQDRVPVIVTGRDYDFEGQGLTIRWNEKDRRLDMLRIAHGKRLVVKNPEALETGPLQRRKGRQASAMPAQRTHHERQSGGGRALPIRLAAADSSAAGEALTQDQAQHKPAYRATFSDQVRILHGDAQVALADELFVDFVFDRSVELEPDSPTAPAQPAAATVPAGHADAAGHAPAFTASTRAQLAADGASAPATQPTPITILWNGPLVVTLLPEDAPRPAAQAANVHMVGSPLLLSQRETQVQARSLIYDTGAEQVTMESSDAYPLVMKDGKGGSVESSALVYSMQDQIATFRGRSRALLPLRGSDGAEPQILSARWSERCVLHLVGEGLESLTADRARFVGEVKIDHPALKLSAASLDLTMEPPPADPAAGSGNEAPGMQLREVAASGAVQCQILDAGKEVQSIQSERLKILTATDPQGELYVRRLEAAGDVVARDPAQAFKAGHLTATLSPARRDAARARDAQAAQPGHDSAPAGVRLAQQVNLEHFIAMDGAEYTSADGKRAAADQIEVLVKDGEPFITLLGEAKVSDGTNILFGPHVQVSGSEQKATVLGAGTLEAKRETRRGEPLRPVTVEWQKGVIADGKANQVDVTGGIVVTTSESDGSSHAITGERLVMALEDAQTEAEKEEKTSRPLMRDKVVRTITISGGAAVRSLRTATEGAILRRFLLTGETLTYDLPARRMTVPVRGRLLFEDHPPRDSAAPARDQEKLAGATAMKWERQLVFDEITGRITLEGDVRIVHEPDPQQKQPGFSLTAQSVTAELEPANDTAPGAAAEDAVAARELKKLTAQGAVRFEAQGVDLYAGRIEYDPTTGIMLATGSDNQPVRVDKGLSRGSFRQARYNLHSGQLQVTDFRGNVR